MLSCSPWPWRRCYSGRSEAAGCGSSRGRCRAVPVPARQCGSNKRLRGALSLIKRLIRLLAANTDLRDDPV
jgi:hypothetical protein